MPALLKTPLNGRIAWLGIVEHREAGLASAPRQELEVDFGGPRGESRGGLTRPSCSRVTDQYARGTTIRNVRQLAIVSAEELSEIATAMGVERLHPSLLGATMLVDGFPDFSHIPPSSRLQAEGGATLVVDMENRPCMLPAKPIEAEHPGKGRKFKEAAQGRRGVTAWVEREGTLRVGEAVSLHIPDQPVWMHLETYRSR